MSGRQGRPRGRGRARTNRRFPRDCYNGRSSGLDDRPAFDSTPFDSSTGGSVWETLPTESIFEPTDCDPRGAPSSEAYSPVPREWLDSREHQELMSFITSTPNLMRCGEDISLAPRVAGGFGGTASPLLRRVLEKSNVPEGPRTSTIARHPYQSPSPSTRPSSCLTFSSGADSTISPRMDSSRLSPGFSGGSRFADSSESAGSHYSQFGDDTDVIDKYQPTIATSPPPPWNPSLASERLEDPDNPPPTFHPMSSNEWRTNPNISNEIRNMYAASCTADSGYHGIYNYGRLSEFNTQNLYDTERFTCLEEQGDIPVDQDCSEVFGDPYEALAQLTDDVPGKYRKEKWHYFELKKRLELFKQLDMERDLAMYEGQLERMEADPWEGDDSGGELEVYMPGTQHDPAMDDRLLEQMEALVAPENEGRTAFYAAMENLAPQHEREMDELLERMEELVAPDNAGRREFFSAMKNPPPWGAEDLYLLEGRFPIIGDLTQLEKLTSYTDPGRRAFERGMENPPPWRDEFADSPDEPASVLEQMKQLAAPTNEGRPAFCPAMERPLPGASKYPDLPDDSVNLLEQMEQLVAPTNEGRAAFYAAMENPPPCTDEFAQPVGDFDHLLEQMEELVAPTNEGLRAFYAAMENPRPGVTSGGYNNRLRTRVGDDDLEALVSPANEQRRAFFAALTGNASLGDASLGNPPPGATSENYCNRLQTTLGDDDLEALVSPANEQRTAFFAALTGNAPLGDTSLGENSPPGATSEGCYNRLQTPSGDDDLEALVSPANEQRRAFFTALMGNDSLGDPDNSLMNCSDYQTCPEGNDSQMAHSVLNTSFTLPEGGTVDFPPGTGPDGC